MAEAVQPVETDVLVVGGGINGAGIARDLAGRGARVLLVEQGDLAQHTSVASTKLIHGGLRYLEYRRFDAVRKALQEREILLKIAPHLVRPMRFVMPHVAALRPAWRVRAGLLLYDYLGRPTTLKGSGPIDLRRHFASAPLVNGLSRGFVYSDASVDDARLVVLNALGAQEHGATVMTRTQLVAAQREGALWDARLVDAAGRVTVVNARAIVNAAGPWADVLPVEQMTPPHAIRRVKGSHIVTRRLFEHGCAYILQNDDCRMVFAIPWQHDYTLIGTTEIDCPDWDADAQMQISEQEIEYLCASVNRYFRNPITKDDIVWSYAGVRSLIDEEVDHPRAVARDDDLHLDCNGAALLSVFGGRLTTYRRLAEEAADLLAAPLRLHKSAWTDSVPLPGGDIHHADFERFALDIQARYRWLPIPLARRYAHAYGTRINDLLANAHSLDALGKELTPNLYEAEVRYLVDREWARSAHDVLWRRTKLGLQAGPQHVARLAAWIDVHASAMTHRPGAVPTVMH
ncbi:MAG: glycerol-3-phosphate dehydrogenase [Burkholderiaceae bacterium]|nr:glycerol-3-phosphate dehydrogenase [Burkholderiaceae bacterium]